MNTLSKIDILGTQITSTHKGKILEYLSLQLGKKKIPVTVFTPNPEIVMYAKKYKDFSHVINAADVALPDGVGIVAAARLLKKRALSRIAGADFVLELVAMVAHKNEELKKAKNEATWIAKNAYSIGLFGGQPGVAELAAECLEQKYSGTQIVYASNVWDEAKLKGKRLGVLFVALGHPKQEKWIMENRDKIPADIVMAVGGSFDFISGRVRRAPVWMQKVGMEWLFRLVTQPWRWKRQLALISFTSEVVKTVLQPPN